MNWLLLIAIIALGCLVFIPIGPFDAIHAVIGEARSEGFRGMYAVSCAIRNRESLRGVHGLTAKLDKQAYKSIPLATLAWFASLLGPDITNGATHWENIKAFGKPVWADHMRYTVRIGRHQFYRGKNV